MLADLLRQLGPLHCDTGPFGTPVPPRYARGADGVESRLVGEVAFTEWTADGSMRHPSWRRLRLDAAYTHSVRSDDAPGAVGCELPAVGQHKIVKAMTITAMIVGTAPNEMIGAARPADSPARRAIS